MDFTPEPALSVGMKTNGNEWKKPLSHLYIFCGNGIGFRKAWIRNGIGIFRHTEMNKYSRKARKINYDYACIKSYNNKDVWTYSLQVMCVNTLTCIIGD
jgi:hypothetical protein